MEIELWPGEEFRPFVGSAGITVYVSNKGRAYGLKANGTLFWHETYPRLIIDNRRGRKPRDKSASIYVGRVPGSRRLTLSISELVLLCFVGPKPLGMVACHGDDNRLNDDASNLSWGPQHNNIVGDATKNNVGSCLCGRVKLTFDKARQIRILRAEGVSKRELSVRFGVTLETIRDVIANRSWEDHGSLAQR